MCHIDADAHGCGGAAYGYARAAYGYASPTHAPGSTDCSSDSVTNRVLQPEPIPSGLYVYGLRRKGRPGHYVWRADGARYASLPITLEW
jgi:hypothetical protein